MVLFPLLQLRAPTQGRTPPLLLPFYDQEASPSLDVIAHGTPGRICVTCTHSNRDGQRKTQPFPYTIAHSLPYSDCQAPSSHPHSASHSRCKGPPRPASGQGPAADVASSLVAKHGAQRNVWSAPGAQLRATRRRQSDTPSFQAACLHSNATLVTRTCCQAAAADTLPSGRNKALQALVHVPQDLTPKSLG